MPEYIIELRSDDGGDCWSPLEGPEDTYKCSVAAYARAQMLARRLMETRGITSLDVALSKIRIRDLHNCPILPSGPCPDYTPREDMHPEFMHKMDWKLLRKQKRTLVNLSVDTERLRADEIDCIEGILNGLDAIQDYAVDVMGIPDETVFGPKDADGYHITEEDDDAGNPEA